ncbi:uncharacterized protein ACB058_010208 [Synchiropus picturatus]
MKVLLLTVTLLLLCSTEVLSLRCIVCTNQLDINCKTSVECPTQDHVWCKTDVHDFEHISKSCATACTDDGVTACCNTDDC